MSVRKDLNDLIRRAQGRGWEYLGINGSGHHRLRWPPTGQKITVPRTPSEYRGLRNAEADLKRICGESMRRKTAKSHAS